MALSSLWESLLDALFPRSERERLLLSLPASEIIRRAPQKGRLPEWQHAALAYRHPLAHTLINLLKYKNSDSAARKCAEILSHELPYLLADALPGERYIVVPIPSSNTRIRERGYSQTERVTRHLISLQVEGAPLESAPLLVKSRDTLPQSKAESRSVRLLNLKGSFAVAGDVARARVILLDDVITTGATLTEARKTLKRAGAKEVLALAVAH